MAMRSFNVRQVINGFIVEVGCMTLVFATFEALKNELTAYHEDSDLIEKKWLGEAEKHNIRGGEAVEAEMPDAVPPSPGELAQTASPMGGGFRGRP